MSTVGEFSHNPHGADWDLFEDIASITRWLDIANVNTPEDGAMRVMKIGEEIGEVNEVWLSLLDAKFGKAVAAYIGMTGQNPRKGHTHTQADLCMELADVAITALCAMAYFTRSGYGTYNPDIVRGFIASKLAGIISRSEIPPYIRQDERALIPMHDIPPIPSHIPAGYCQRCTNSGVGACDDYPNCPAGRQI